MKIVPTVLAMCMFACKPAAPTVFALREAPPEYAAAIGRADAAIREVRQEHGLHMNRAMSGGGIPAAIEVCSQKARAITDELSEGTGLKIGRSSARLRNPDNQPPPWLASYVAGLDGKRASEVKPQVFDLGDRVGVVRPIPTAKVCTKCHGKPEALDPAGTTLLRDTYSKDRATGFEVGDVRGVFWVEVPKS